jgi:DNA-binding NarL/FixJ family response regulator
MVRERLVQVINEHKDLIVCGEAADAKQAMVAIKKLNPDLVLVDLILRQSSGLELIKDIRILDPELPSLVISMHEESTYAERVLRAGAHGYMSKQEATVRVIDAIRHILSGDIWVSEPMRRHLLKRFIGSSIAKTCHGTERLSDREIQVFEMIGRGMTTGQIGEALHVHPHTVETYRVRIKDKLGLSGSTQVLLEAARWFHVENASQTMNERSVQRHRKRSES